MTSRREFVAMLLGAPLALACRRDRPLPGGELIDTGMRRGHQFVRDAAPVTPTTWRHARVVIVGAGVAGLGAAWALRRAKLDDVLVLDLCDVPGGTARGGASDVTPYPWGAHYIVAPQREQDELISLLGDMGAFEGTAPDGTPIVDEALRCREPEERVFYRGRWYDGLYLDAGATLEDRRQWTRFRAELDRWSGWRDADGRRAFAIPTARSSPDPALAALDAQSFAAWLDERGFTSERLRWLCNYACRDDYALMAADASAWAGLFYFAARQKGPGAPPQSVVTWPDGNGAIVAHLARGATIEQGVTVQRVRAEAAGVAITAIGRDGAAFGIRAEHAILAVPAFVANRLVDRHVTAGDYGAWAVANVHLRDRPREAFGAPAAWDNVFRDSPSLGYVSATHQRGRDRGPTVWTWYYPFPGDARAAREQLAGAGHAEWAEVVLADLERAHPEIRTLVERIDVAFWGHGMVRPRVGARFDPARAARAAPLGAIHFAHTDLSGLALFEEAFDHGLRAAAEVVAALT
ncbi:MAG TPA: NAD(P)-binding protein [Kofleriaceae bacterium]|jgi:phytoene dehydrogenase-like protein